MVRTLGKAGLERLLLQSGIARLTRSRLTGCTLILGYHNVVPGRESLCGDRSLHLDQERFAAQLDVLESVCEVVPLDTVLDAPGLAGPRPRVAITFDDAYRGAVTVGVEELVKRGMPGTIFVPPAFLNGASFWWDSLAGNEPLDAGLREHVVEVLQGRDRAARIFATQEGYTEHRVPAHARCATEHELRAAVERPGITLGAHSWSHVNLASIGSDELRDELVRPLAWLRERFPSVVPWLSYPYGRFSTVVERAVAAAGYVAALRTEGGWFPMGRAPRLALPRLDVPAGISKEGFQLRISGLFC